MNAAELATHSERVLRLGPEFFYAEPSHLACDDGVHFHDVALKSCPTLMFGREHTGAFVAAFAEMMREFY